MATGIKFGKKKIIKLKITQNKFIVHASELKCIELLKILPILQHDASLRSPFYKHSSHPYTCIVCEVRPPHILFFQYSAKTVRSVIHTYFSSDAVSTLCEAVPILFIQYSTSLLGSQFYTHTSHQTQCQTHSIYVKSLSPLFLNLNLLDKALVIVCKTELTRSK